MPPAVRAVWVLALLFGMAAAGEPSWYACDCSGRSNCMCPSLEPPGGLQRKHTPQFVLFTHDDSVEQDTDEYIRKICDGQRNPNMCPMRATLFTMVRYSDCDLVWSLWNDGYEIADHSISHPRMSNGYSKADTEYEINGMRSWVAEQCGVPKRDVRGFRNPYLETNPEVRKVLHKSKFLYDSTLMEGNSESLSYPMDERVWPYTLDFGIAQNCDWYAPSQICEETERYPGLWEVPMWTLSATGAEYTMDYGRGGGVFDILKKNFDETYRGNRAPFPIYVHTPWFTDESIHDLKKFRDYTKEFGDVYWVTMTQLIEWMQNPVSADEMRNNGAMCGNAPPPPPPPPPPMAVPTTGLNVTLVLSGATETALVGKLPTLLAAMKGLLGSGASSLAVRSTQPLTEAAAGAAAASHKGGKETRGERRRRLMAELSARYPEGGAAEFLEYEAPTFPGFHPAVPSAGGSSGAAGLGAVGAQSMDGDAGEGAAGDGGPTVLRVALTAGGGDPLAMYAKALASVSNVTLGPALSSVGLTLVAQPTLVPFKNGVALMLPPPPSPPSPRPPPRPMPPTDSPDLGNVHSESHPSGAATDASSTDSSGLPQWAIIAIAAGAGGLALLAAAALLAAVTVRRRRAAATPAAASALSTYNPAFDAGEECKAEGKQAGEEEEGQRQPRRHTTITLDAAAA